MLGRIQGSHQVQDFFLLQDFLIGDSISFTSYRSIQISYFFVTVVVGLVFLGICPFHLGHPICWHTTAQSAL